MRILFVHNNFPAQFVHLAPALAARGHSLAAISSSTGTAIANIPLAKYNPVAAKVAEMAHLRRFQTHIQRGLGVVPAAKAIKAQGFLPDLIFGHIGWGETIFLREVFPDARMALYAEFYYSPRGADVGFDPEFGDVGEGEALMVRARNAGLALSMAGTDFALAPTQFQRNAFPPIFRDRIVVQHDGVDTRQLAPRAGAEFTLPDNKGVLTAADEVITYVNRHLEPMRGIHVFIRSLPKILAARPNAQVIIIGGDDGNPYGPAAPKGTTWPKKFLKEVQGQVDLSRVHFVGRQARKPFIDALAISKAHVYLTAPFVLSWSLIDAMAMACPIIASDTPPVREAIRHGENGLLVDYFQPEALADAVIRALADPAAMAPLRAQARADAIATYDLASVCLPRLVALTEAWGRGEAMR